MSYKIFYIKICQDTRGKAQRSTRKEETSIHFKDDTTHNSFKITEYILLVNVKEEKLVYLGHEKQECVRCVKIFGQILVDLSLLKST